MCIRDRIIESMAIELAKYPSEIQQCVFEEHFANDGHNSWKNTSPRQVGQYLDVYKRQSPSSPPGKSNIHVLLSSSVG